MMNMNSRLCLLALLLPAVEGFAPRAFTGRHSVVSLREAVADVDADIEEPKMNPDNPNLPELKNDFDWDAKFGGDDDWITEDVPGKTVLNEIDLAKQVTTLTQLEEKWRKERQITEYDDGATVGFVENAETLNGRFAMFFLVTGLFTESFTGISMPGQVEEMLRIGGFIGFE
jgi:hypothetical protein